MSCTSHREHLARGAVVATLYGALTAAQADRPKRNEFVDTPTGPELDWVLHERAVMLAETNRWRGIVDLPPVSEATIRSAESSACGHVDYTDKYALYCADIVFSEETSR